MRAILLSLDKLEVLMYFQDRMFINDATKEIMLKERVHRTRSTALQSTGKVGIPSLVQL